jgi:hypothetical protein
MILALAAEEFDQSVIPTEFQTAPQRRTPDHPKVG